MPARVADCDLGPLCRSLIVDHPIPLARIDEAFDWSAKFFDLPMEVKKKTPWNGKNMGHEYKSVRAPPLPSVAIVLALSRVGGS